MAVTMVYTEIDYMLDLIHRDIQLLDDICDVEMQDCKDMWERYVEKASSVSLRETDDCCAVCTTRQVTYRVLLSIVEYLDEQNYHQDGRPYQPIAERLFLQSLKKRCLRLNREL